MVEAIRTATEDWREGGMIIATRMSSVVIPSMVVPRASLIVLVVVIIVTVGVDAATLAPKTAQDFGRYAAAMEARRARDLAAEVPFLEIDRLPPNRRAQAGAELRRGEVVVARATATDDGANEIEVNGGLISHWRGTVLVPNVTLEKLLLTLMEPQTDRHQQEDVLASRVVARDGDSMKLYLRLRRTKFVTVVYDTEYDVEYHRLASDKAWSRSLSTKIVEVENVGTPQERTLQEGADHGFLWRLYTYWRYQQVEGGVMVEIESLTLSRELPFLVGPLIRPIVNHIARESMSRTLASLRARFAS